MFVCRATSVNYIISYQLFIAHRVVRAAGKTKFTFWYMIGSHNNGSGERFNHKQTKTRNIHCSIQYKHTQDMPKMSSSSSSWPTYFKDHSECRSSYILNGINRRNNESKDHKQSCTNGPQFTQQIAIYHTSSNENKIYLSSSRHINDEQQNCQRPSVQNDKYPTCSAYEHDCKPRQYQDCIRDICTLQSNADAIATAGIDPSERMPLFIEHLRLAGINLEDLNDLNIIHVSGTKGKGSTCAFVESILRANNFKTGFFNSPHLIKYTERIRLDGQPISDDKFSLYFSTVFDKLKLETERAGIRMPAFFAFMTILAFYTFLKERVQVAIMEVGIGGILDTTNVVNEPVVCGITSLDYDHLTILGDTIESIAKHKAGIIKRGVPVFTVEQPAEALTVIKAEADFMDCPLSVCPPIDSYDLAGDLDLGIKGQAQGTNASLAVKLCRVWMKRQSLGFAKLMETKEASCDLDLSLDDRFVEGLTNCHWPGRCQTISRNNITFFLDGAHTVKSLLNCKDWFREASRNISESNQSDAGKTLYYLILNIIGDRSRESLMGILIDLELNAAIFTTNKVSLGRSEAATKTTLDAHVTSSDKYTGPASHHNANIWRCLMEKRGHHDNHHQPGIIEVGCTLEAIEYVFNQSRQHPASEHHVLVTGSLHLVGAIFGALELIEINNKGSSS